VHNGTLNVAISFRLVRPLLRWEEMMSSPVRNLGRNIYRGPHQQNWDFSMLKNFRLTERKNSAFTTDFFNIWNHANFANPAVTTLRTRRLSEESSQRGNAAADSVLLRYGSSSQIRRSWQGHDLFRASAFFALGRVSRGPHIPMTPLFSLK